METTKEYLDLVHSESPAPGGGSVAGYTAALGVALICMAMNISMKRKAYNNYSEAEKKYNLNRMAKLKRIESDMYAIKELDVKVFNDFMVAYKSKDQKEIHKMTIKCFLLPYNLFELIDEAIEVIFYLRKYIVKSVLSDYKMSLIMLKSMLDASIVNMKINLDNLTDSTCKQMYLDKLARKAVLANQINEKLNAE